MENKTLISNLNNQIKTIIHIVDGIDCLTKAFVDESVRIEIASSCITLIKTISSQHKNIESQEFALINALDNASTDLIEISNSWINVVNTDIFNDILYLNDSDCSLSIIDLKNIIDYIIFIKYDNFKVFVKLFKFLTSYGHFLPMETFGIGMYIVERYNFITNNPDISMDYAYSVSEDIQHEFRQCVICGGEGEPYITTASYKMDNFTNPHLPFKLWMKCSNCHNCYSRYISSYSYNFSTQAKTITPKPPTLNHHEPSSAYLFIWNEIFNKIQLTTQLDNVLQVGVGICDSIAVALELGFDIDVVEKFEDVAIAASDILEIPIFNCDFLEFNPNKKYSSIIMEGFIEKTSNPKEVLLKAYDLLSDNGVLWISTPNYNSAFSRIRRENYVMWLEPTNVSFFCKESFYNLLDECGFTVNQYSISQRYKGFMELFIQKK